MIMILILGTIFGVFIGSAEGESIVFAINLFYFVWITDWHYQIEGEIHKAPLSIGSRG